MATRRTVLLSLVALPWVPACGSGGGSDNEDPLDGYPVGDDDDATRPPEPEPFELRGEIDLAAFPAGIQVTDARPDSVLLALRSTEPDLEIHLGREEEGGDVLVAFDSEVLAVPEGILNFELSDLEPDTAYELYAVDPSGLRRSELTSFRTALAPGTSRSLRIAVSCCLGRAGAPWPSLGHAAAQRPDLCLLLGDTVYADGATTLPEYRDFWHEAMETTGLKNMASVTSIVATWDDHEVANNWTWAQHGGRVESALAAFRESLPQREGPDAERTYRSLVWGDAVELIALDSRADRGNGLYLSEAQMDWLKDRLTTSTARFKLIMNSVPIIDFGDWIGGLGADDRWQGTPGQREELLAFIEDQGVAGVLFLSGDMHFGSICRISPPGEVGDQLWEVMAGPSGSNINPMAWFPPDGSAQFDLVLTEWNSVLLDLDPESGEVVVTFLGDTGDALGERVLQL